jgi:hypothetical protein
MMMIIIITIIMSLGENVTELRPPTGLLFIPQVIYGHGKPLWNDIYREI